MYIAQIFFYITDKIILFIYAKRIAVSAAALVTPLFFTVRLRVLTLLSVVIIV